MDEIINTDYAGIIVENTEQALESGIERLLQMTEGDLNKYKEGARARSTDFTTDACVREFEDFIDLPYE